MVKRGVYDWGTKPPTYHQATLRSRVLACGVEREVELVLRLYEWDERLYGDGRLYESKGSVN